MRVAWLSLIVKAAKGSQGSVHLRIRRTRVHAVGGPQNLSTVRADRNGEIPQRNSRTQRARLAAKAAGPSAGAVCYPSLPLSMCVSPLGW